MSDMCEHETFRDICGVCHRNTIIEKQEIEITALRAVNDALSEHMMTMIDNASKVATLRAEKERLKVQSIQMQAALGYAICAEDERHIIPSNPYRCGICDANKHLRATNDALKEQVATMIDNAARVASLRAENARLREALEFYADKENYSEQLVAASCGSCCDYEDAKIFTDEGGRARAALTPPEKEASDEQ